MTSTAKSLGLAILLAPLLAAQTSATGTIIGTVTDPSGSVVSAVNLTLLDLSSSASRSALSSAEGQFSFVAISPGAHRLTATMPGFRQLVVEEIRVEVAKSYVVNLALQVGAVTETLTVTAGAGAELQTLDASVGAVHKGESMLRLPTVNRSAGALFSVQPLITPSRGISQGGQGGQAAGTRSDQNTFNLDGADATETVSGSATYFRDAIDWSGPTPGVPVPLESVEEFRILTTNPNATFGRSAGAQVNLVTKRGTNSLHGSAYWYHQNDNLNANSWTFNRLGIRRPELKDNRYGASLGGPVRQDKTFLFGHFEGRRFPRSTVVSRLVPSQQVRQGVLRFRDANGTVVPYDIQAFDPRTRGLSPVISALWNKLPPGNDASAGDGLNTLNFTGPADNSIQMDFGVARLDHYFTGNWRMASTYRYASQAVNDISQLDIAGITGGASGQIRSGGRTPVEPRYFTTQVFGNFRPRLISEFVVGYKRNYWAYRRIQPVPQVPGTAAALGVAAGVLDSGIDVDINRTRSRSSRDQTYQMGNNLTWLRGKHTLQFGGTLWHTAMVVDRDDKTGGALTAPVYDITAGAGASIGAANRPPTCSATLRANCLQAGDVTRWNTLFASSLGMVDRGAALIIRDAQLNAAPPGSRLRAATTWQSYEGYVNDIWRLTSSLTITAGLSYAIQTPPVERDGQQLLVQDNATGQPITTASFFATSAAAARQGQIYNPQLGFLPIRNASPSRANDIDKNNVGPRISAAWNPAGSGWMARLLGNRRTVIRGGYAVTFDRVSAIILGGPSLGVGFAQTSLCVAPRTNGVCANTSDATNAFRIGVDGASVNLPALSKPSLPVTPGISGEALSNLRDPKIQIGRTQSINLTVQRELPGNFIVEVGYVARISNQLQQVNEFNSVPYMFTDPASGQTFGQALNLVGDQVRAGVPGANVSPQPFFENQLRGTSVCNPACTPGLAAARTAEFNQGQWNNLTNFINNSLRPTNPFYNRQIVTNSMRSSGGESFYSGGFLSVTRRFSQGLSFTANYTLSRALDQYGTNQESTASSSTPYDYSVDWGPAIFDRTHVFNAAYFYELPRWAGKHPVLSRLANGWYLTGLLQGSSGVPLLIGQHPQGFGGAQTFTGLASGMIPKQAGFDYSTTVNRNSAGSGAAGINGDPARGGSGMNVFADPAAVLASVRHVRIGEDGRHGRDVARGLQRWNFDASIGKRIAITERVRAVFSFDLINAFNRVEFADPATSFFTPATFGVITGQYASPRQIQVGLRVEF